MASNMDISTPTNIKKRENPSALEEDASVSDVVPSTKRKTPPVQREVMQGLLELITSPKSYTAKVEDAVKRSTAAHVRALVAAHGSSVPHTSVVFYAQWLARCATHTFDGGIQLEHGASVLASARYQLLEIVINCRNKEVENGEWMEPCESSVCATRLYGRNANCNF